MTLRTSEIPGARERLLAAADELFYENGVHTVGIDRVIERADVAKATLYSTFGSKEELVLAYLRARHASTQAKVERALKENYASARERLIGVFEVQGTNFVPGFRGCAFVGASAESKEGGAVQRAADDFRAWLRGLFLHLTTEAGAPDPLALARQLILLYDGAIVTAWMDRDPNASVAALSAARVLVEAALPSRVNAPPTTER
jgi:AcrR family transcriptional regulator